MLKTRVMPTLLFKNVGLVKGVGFESWRRVGTALQSIRVYNLREVDELILLDIGATPNGSKPNFNEIDELADNCFMPMTVGGGVSTIEDIRSLLAVGADKVSINSAAIATPDLIRDGARQFGTQCIVVSMDIKRANDGAVEVISHCGTTATGRDAVSWAKEVEALGAGEILLTSIERDGTMTGYDVDLVRDVSSAVNIPVIASGGCGNYEHMAEVLLGSQAAAVAAASIFHFTEQTPLEAKRYLADRGFRMRL
ncbi:imidazole glycerol phosphate synthase subunit HisF [Tardiphaga alba]|uniref:Imidazole glycerol phosphate synthase subunit HisF n=1 Tax=Tardiphaga alba TaxID=340268 RepID=A0ABX8A9J0_9BRAD|nr:imidazole glycerol phosphate synthase cyclase subunit [Tardiphaga alba]QUS39108.1 imidazole glycerol phosphate synthase subunit HisF [Tardiphaga alba]